MPTSSFDKEVIITEPEAIERLVNSLLYDEPRKPPETDYLSEENQAKTSALLKKVNEKWKLEHGEE